MLDICNCFVGRLSDESGSGGRFVLPSWWEHAFGLVVTSQTVDARLGQNQTEFGVAVLKIQMKAECENIEKRTRGALLNVAG